MNEPITFYREKIHSFSTEKPPHSSSKYHHKKPINYFDIEDQKKHNSIQLKSPTESFEKLPPNILRQSLQHKKKTQ
jgi:hypothetical protein